MKTKNELKNYAFIDCANLYRGILELGWKLDFKRFRIFLKDKYGIEKAYLFIGFISTNSKMYEDLQNWGYTLIFKPTIPNGHGGVKGNVDAELVLHAVSDFYEKKFDQAILVTGDGDFACLATFLHKKGGLKVILSPNSKKCSNLFRQYSDIFRLTFMEGLRNKLEYKKRKSP